MDRARDTAHLPPARTVRRAPWQHARAPIGTGMRRVRKENRLKEALSYFRCTRADTAASHTHADRRASEPLPARHPNGCENFSHLRSLFATGFAQMRKLLDRRDGSVRAVGGDPGAAHARCERIARRLHADFSSRTDNGAATAGQKKTAAPGGRSFSRTRLSARRLPAARRTRPGPADRSIRRSRRTRPRRSSLRRRHLR